MKIVRGLLFGFIVGAVVGLIIYLKMQRQRDEPDLSLRAMRIEIAEEKPPAARPAERKPKQPASRPAGKTDDLTGIRGIGQVYARRLQEAGIRTFADLAAATPARLAEIIGPRARLADLKAWIADAKKQA